MSSSTRSGRRHASLDVAATGQYADPRHRVSASTLVGSSSPPPNSLHGSPASVSAGATSNSPYRRSLEYLRPRRGGAGGFLLDGGSRKSSLERSSLDKERGPILYTQPSFHSEGSTAVAGGQRASESGSVPAGDTDPARMVSLVLGETEKRKKQAQSKARQSLSVPPASGENPAGLSGMSPVREAGGRGRTVSPTRSFLMGGRSSSQARRFIASLSSSSPSSPPPAPARSSFPTPALAPMPFQAPAATKRRSFGHQQLRELQNQYKFTEATLQRTLKARQVLELSALYKKLLEIQSPESAMGGFASALAEPGSNLAKRGVYNPLQVIRNRKLRSRKKVHLDVGPWEDPGAVEQWVEDVAVSLYSPNPDGGIPNPPPSPGPPKKMKRPKMDWIITPQEMLADHYWVECEASKARALERERADAAKRRRAEEADVRSRKSVETGSRDGMTVEHESSDDETRESIDVPRRKRVRDDYRFLITGMGYESTATSSESDTSDSDTSSTSDDSEADADGIPGPKKDKHHRRRRKLKNVITAGRYGKKKKKLERQDLELAEKRRRQGTDEVSWMQSSERVQPEQLATDVEYDSSGRGPAKLQKTGTESTAYSVPAFADSRSSLERGTNISGLGIIPGRRQDTSDYVVPSIAINLSPPRARAREEDEREEKKWRRKGTDDILERDEDSRKSPTKKLMEMGKDAFQVKDRDVDDGERDSLDMERPVKKAKDGKLGRVKTRVEKIRNEVAKVEDYIWKRDNSNMPSPVASSFDESIGARTDDEGNAFDRRFGLEIATDDEAFVQKANRGRSSLEVPDPIRITSKHKSHYSTGHLPTFGTLGVAPQRKSIESERSPSPDKFLRAKHTVSRDPSPVRRVIIESVNRRTPDASTTTDITTTRVPLRREKPDFALAPPPWQQKQRLSALSMESLPQSTTATPSSSPAVSQRDLHRAHAQLLSAGILARALTRTAPRVHHSLAPSAHASAAQIDSLFDAFTARTQHFTTQTTPPIYERIEAAQHMIAIELTPQVRAIADDADELSGRVTTELTLGVKRVSDEVDTLLRRRRRRMRWVRRGAYLLLEWCVLGVMWWVWLVVVILRVCRGVGRGVWRGVRWILWL